VKSVAKKQTEAELRDPSEASRRSEICEICEILSNSFFNLCKSMTRAERTDEVNQWQKKNS